MVADQDVYRIQVKKPNGEDYYELLLVYVDDVLFYYHDPQLIMDTLALAYDLKGGPVVLPKFYLGTEMKKYQVGSGKSHWNISSTQYVENEINTEEHCKTDTG